MKCRVCGGRLESAKSNLPFKVSEKTIVIVKGLPVAQCSRCSEYLIEDGVFARVEELLASVDPTVELEIVPYAA